MKTESKLSKHKIQFERLPDDKELAPGATITYRTATVVKNLAEQVAKREHERLERNQKLGSYLAAMLIGGLIIIWLLWLANSLIGYSVSNDQAICNSLYGVWSSESNQCYHDGKPVSIDELKKQAGVK